MNFLLSITLLFLVIKVLNTGEEYKWAIISFSDWFWGHVCFSWKPNRRNPSRSRILGLLGIQDKSISAYSYVRQATNNVPLFWCIQKSLAHGLQRLWCVVPITASFESTGKVVGLMIGGRLAVFNSSLRKTRRVPSATVGDSGQTCRILPWTQGAKKYWISFAYPLRKITFAKYAKAANFMFAFGVEKSQFATMRMYSVNLVNKVFLHLTMP